MTVAYVSAKPSQYMRILQVRNNIHNVVDDGHYYRKQKPHITLVPPFKIKDDCKDKIKKAVSKVNLRGNSIEDNGISVHQSVDNPFAVFISIDLETNGQLEELRDELQQYSKVPVIEGQDSHISLFKTRGYWDSVPQSVSDKLVNEIEYYNPIKEIEVQRLNLVFRR